MISIVLYNIDMIKVNFNITLILLLIIFLEVVVSAKEKGPTSILFIKYGSREIKLEKDFFIINDKAYVNENFLPIFFDLSLKTNQYTKKHIIQNVRVFIQSPLSTNYVMNGRKIFYIEDPFIEREEGVFLSEDIFTKVISKALLKNISVKKKTINIQDMKGSQSLANKYMTKFNGVLERIIIDPGHGGADEGAHPSDKSLAEKNIVLGIVKDLKSFIEANSKLKVFLTRNKDEFVPLRARTQMGNNIRANLFISIHLNASENIKASGFEVFISDPDTTDEEAALIAKVENSVLRFEKEDYKKFILEDIFADMKTNSYKADSLQFAEILMSNNKIFKSRGISQAPFVVLTGLNMPSVLLELGFITNAKDKAILLSRHNKQKIIKNIFYSIMEFKRKFDEKYSGSNEKEGSIEEPIKVENI